MKRRTGSYVPAAVALAGLGLVTAGRVVDLSFVERLEATTYDWRVRMARHFPGSTATNLGFVFFNDDSIEALGQGRLLGTSLGLHWPRHVYGRALRELSAQGIRAVGFDVLFSGLRPDHAPVAVAAGEAAGGGEVLTRIAGGKPPLIVEGKSIVESDDFFAWQLASAPRAVVAADKDVLPHPLFRTNAFAVGDVSADKDVDGVLRRARAFKLHRHWHPLFEQAQREYGVSLAHARVRPGEIVLRQPDGNTIRVPLDAAGRFALADFTGGDLPPGTPEKDFPFRDERVWHLGIVLAAVELDLDLERARVNLGRGRITLPGRGGGGRVIPVTPDGCFYIDWALGSTDGRLTKESLHSILEQDLARTAGRVDGLTNRWAGRLAVIGSSATGNDLTDRGPTPIEKEALLVSMHWNVANSVITNRFVWRAPLWVDLVILTALGLVTAVLSWRLRAMPAALAVLCLGLAYAVGAVFLFGAHRVWIPLVLPLVGATFVEHTLLVTYRVMFEQREQRRVRGIFAKVVSPNVVQELLGVEKLALGGARREVTILFADVRGFTALTDRSREVAAEQVRRSRLSDEEAEAFYDAQARDTLQTVNLYLATVADEVKRHRGTLDKYIGDCVMAFWGAPTANPRHASACVRAAIDAQRAIEALNTRRAAENQRREQENVRLSQAGQPPLPPLPILKLGSGINTGVAIVGLMGSDQHILNYTVFGREVNLASRLESVSGHGRIVIGQATHEALLREAPELAARCKALEPVTVKGIRDVLTCYEVPWREEPAQAGIASPGI